MPTTSHEKAVNVNIVNILNQLEKLVGENWTGKTKELFDETDKLIRKASTELTTTFENVLKKASKVGGKLFDTSLARDMTQSKDITKIYNEYIEQIQKIQNREFQELKEKYENITKKGEELIGNIEGLQNNNKLTEQENDLAENIKKQIKDIIKENKNEIEALKNSMPQKTFSNTGDEVADAPKHNSKKEARNALRQDIMKKIPEIFLSPLNVAANIVSAILRCLIAIVETAVLGILTLNAQILPEQSKQAELKQIADYKSFVKESVINAKSYSHAILAYATKIKENASTYLETHDNPSYSHNKEENKALLNNSPDVFDFDKIHAEEIDKDGNQQYISNPGIRHL